MDRPTQLRFHRAASVYRITEHVEDSAERFFTHRNCHGRSRVDALVTTNHAVRASQRDATHASTAKMLLNLAGKIELYTFVFADDLDRVVDWRKVLDVKLSVKCRSDHLGDAAHCGSCCCHGYEFSVFSVQFSVST